MKKTLTLIALLTFSIICHAQINLGIRYANYVDGQTFSNDTIQTEFIIENFGTTMYNAGDTFYVNARINGMLFSLDLLGSSPTPVILTSMMMTGDTIHFNPGILSGSATLPFFPPATTLNVCLVLWGKGIASVTPAFGGDADTLNNTTCVTYDPTFVTGISAENSGEVEVNIFPNPSCDYVNFNVNLNQTYEIKVFDISGKEITTVQSSDNLTTIDFTSNASGMYFYTVYTKENIIKSGRFIKQ
jgi:hypothetical protein